jgi:gentisate 1,2-dioxygenase
MDDATAPTAPIASTATTASARRFAETAPSRTPPLQEIPQTAATRIVRIPPHRSNERLRLGQESIFVVLSGSGEVLIGEARFAVRRGDVAFVPRWFFQQATNTGDDALVLLAITDFGLASAAPHL